MTAILRLLGILGVVDGVLGFLLAFYYAMRLAPDTAWTWLLVGVVGIVAGPTLYCLGTITDHLASIDRNGQKYLDAISGKK